MQKKSATAAARLRHESGVCQDMRKGRKASSSSESEDNRLCSKNSEDQSSPCSSDEDSLSASDLEAECAMKRSQRFNSSFSFEEDQQLQSENERREEPLPGNCTRVPAKEVEESDVGKPCLQTDKKDTCCDTNQTGPSLFRPQDLWLAMAKCLSLRWLSINRQSNRNLQYQADIDQSEETQSSVNCDTTDENSSSTRTSGDRNVSLLNYDETEVSSRVVKSCPAPRQGLSHSSPRLPRARQATDSLMASMILEKEMFLSIELMDLGEEGNDLRYRAEWKLSEKTKELAEGVWVSRSQNLMEWCIRVKL